MRLRSIGTGGAGQRTEAAATPFFQWNLLGAGPLQEKGAHMPKFYFKTKDNDGISPGDAPFEYPSLMAAIDQAKKVLAEMALDGIPSKPDSAGS